jgi:hypothetical protein
MAARIYDWDKWLDRPKGGSVLLSHGRHYHVSQSSFIQRLRNVASQRGYRVSVQDLGTRVRVTVTCRPDLAVCGGEG